MELDLDDSVATTVRWPPLAREGPATPVPDEPPVADRSHAPADD